MMGENGISLLGVILSCGPNAHTRAQASGFGHNPIATFDEHWSRQT